MMKLHSAIFTKEAVTLAVMPQRELFVVKDYGEDHLYVNTGLLAGDGSFHCLNVETGDFERLPDGNSTLVYPVTLAVIK